MRRRQFIAGLGAVVAWPISARGQEPSPIRRLGLLVGYSESDTTYQSWIGAVLAELQALGWHDQRSVRIDVRWVGPDPVRLGAEATELLGNGTDVIFATPHGAAETLHRLTGTTPIVVVQSGDLVRAGLAQSFARPGGNITGFTLFEETINTKYVQLLKEIAPQLRRVAIFQSEGTAWRNDAEAIAAAAKTFGVEAISLVVREAADIGRLLAAFADTPRGGLIIPPDGFISTYRRQIIALASAHRLPTMWNSRVAVADGGLIRYGTDFIDIYRRSASYVDRVLRGEKPANLPVQAPTKYELAINLNTAASLGLTVPETLLATADEVIQ